MEYTESQRSLARPAQTNLSFADRPAGSLCGAEIVYTTRRAACRGMGPHTFIPNLSTGLVLLLLGMLLAVFPDDDPVSADCWKTSIVALAMFSKREFISWGG